jgi:hypothetical protein
VVLRQTGMIVCCILNTEGMNHMFTIKKPDFYTDITDQSLVPIFIARQDALTLCPANGGTK